MMITDLTASKGIRTLYLPTYSGPVYPIDKSKIARVAISLSDDDTPNVLIGSRLIDGKLYRVYRKA